jgi:hypothetical protein
MRCSELFGGGSSKSYLLCFSLLCFANSAVPETQEATAPHPKPPSHDLLPDTKGSREYSSFHLNYLYPGEFPSAQDIDFKNLVAHTFSGPSRHLICGKLVNGSWDADFDDHSHESLTLSAHYPLPSQDVNAKFFLVILEEEGVSGSSNSTGFAQVWKWKDGKLSIAQQINYDTHFETKDSFETFESKRNRLTVRSSHQLDFDAHCCISAYDQLTFEWSGEDLRLVRKSLFLTEYGKSQHRTLPSK